jgi:hypothetical protein
MKRFRSAITGKWVSRLFAKQHPMTTVSETITHNAGNVLTWPPNPTITGSAPPTPQCQYCGYAVDWNALECPNCHAILDEGEGGVPA